ncbi:thioredoxin family protein [Candidatus Woesearchaeota archaeon]|nr:thioredoxin family protein [Candidatus Woesearchaeota archaeon]
MVLLKSDPRTLQKGSDAPNFSLKNVDGSIVNLADFKSRIVVIIFMCNHCPYVKPKMGEISSIQEDYRNKGVVVIGINSNDPDFVPEDSFENMQEIAKKFKYEYYLFDETQEVAKKYGATCTPDPFVFDSKHKLVYHGRINDAMNPGDTIKKHVMRKVLNKVVNKEEVEEWFLPSMGCSIKWKGDSRV